MANEAAVSGPTRRSVIVTGGAKGIGGAMVRGLLDHGHRVVAADRDAAALDALAREIGEAARMRLWTCCADLTAEGAAEGLVATAQERFGRIDVLVNNAGIGMITLRTDYATKPLRFWEVEPAQWRRFLEVNATVAFLCSRLVAPTMVRQGFGRIVNVTTSLGSMLRPGNPTYGPSKACLEALAAVMAGDLSGTGVTCNVLIPGGTTNTTLVSAADESVRARMIQPEAMLPPLLWLISDAAAEVTARRFLAAHWDASLSQAEAAERAGAPIAWTDIATMPITPA